MKQTKVYPHELEEKGFVRANWREMNECKLDKSSYVQTFLSPAVINAKCGWHGVEYVAYTNGEEYVFFIDSHVRLSRGICVTADSKQAIATAVFDNID